MSYSSAQHRRQQIGVGIAALVFAAALFVLHFPGQATYDTLAQAYDGATRIYTSNQPPSMSLILSILTMPGVLALQLILFAFAVWRLLTLSGATLPTQYVLLGVLFMFPVLLIYVGIVWKDVLFAHGAVLAVLLLPVTRLGPRLWALIASAIVLAVAVAVRQQGVLVAAVVLVYLLLGGGISGLKSRGRWKLALLWLSVFIACSGGIRFAVNNSGDTTQSGSFEGPLRQLAMFDLGGILRVAPQMEFPAIERGAPDVPLEHRPDRQRIIEQLQRYSPQRQDFMAEPDGEPHMWIQPAAWFQDWAANVVQHPGGYVAHRLDFMGWLLGCRDPNKCLPFAVGVPAEPAAMAEALGVTSGISSRAALLGKIGNASIFLFRPWIYILLSLVSLLYLIQLDRQRHSSMIALQLCGLLYAASYFFIGIACDFRYTYFSTITGLFGLAYVVGLVLSPPARHVST